MKVCTLQSNLREIYRALKSPENNLSFLVADPSGKNIFSSTDLFGRLWSWYYKIRQPLKDEESPFSNLHKAILHTHEVFRRHLLEAVPHLINYQKYLDARGNGYAVNEDLYFTARSRITKWNATTEPFIRLVQSQAYPQCHEHEIFKTFLLEHTDELQNCQKIIDLEGITESPLPIEIFEKILRGKNVNPSDTKEINQWIVRLNKINPEVGRVHKALEAISIQFKQKTETEAERKNNLSRLELYLDDNGCTVFQKTDPTHLAWQQNLSSGTKLYLNGEEVVIGQEMRGYKFANDFTHVYSLEGQPEKVAVIVHNCALLALRDALTRRSEYFGLKPANFLEISHDGSFALMERLQPLNTIQWTSTEDQLHPEDKPRAMELAKFVEQLIKQQMTPLHLSPSFLMFDREHHLRVTRPLVKEPFDFNRIEDFIAECASGNQMIFKYLMITSGLATHPTARFYTDLILGSIEGDQIAPDDLAGYYMIGDPKVVDRGVALVKQIGDLQQQLYASLGERAKTADPLMLRRKINQAILACRNKYKSAGIIFSKNLILDFI
ncbi:MAG: hypothetical protein WCF65_00690 [Parachlamydiaceae bacterium]